MARRAPREYMRSTTPVPVTHRLIAVTVLTFVLSVLWPPLASWGYFSTDLGVRHVQLWRFVTFQFLHQGVAHVAFNMFVLYFFGPMIEEHLGRRRYLAFYLMCGVGGALLFVLLGALGFRGTTAAVDVQPLIGASAGVFGVLIAAARISPDEVVDVYGSIPLKLKTVAWIFIAIAVATVLFRWSNAGGEAAHLGGAILGFILIRRPDWLNVFRARPAAAA